MIHQKILDSYLLFEDPIMVATSANATRFFTRNRKSERDFAHTTTDWSPHGGNPVGFAQVVVQPRSPSGGKGEEGCLGDLFLPVHALLAPNALQRVVTQKNLDPCSLEPITLGHYSSSQVPKGELKVKVLEGRSESCKTSTKDPGKTVGEVSCTGHRILVDETPASHIIPEPGILGSS